MAAAAGKAGRPTILIVDDTPANIQVLADALKAEYHILVAANGAKAMAVATGEFPPDLILLDVMMPDLNGYEVCRRLKETPAASAIPVIFVTARDAVEDETRGLDLGAVDYITKSFHLPILRARVKTHVNLKLKTDLLERLALLDGLTHIPNRRRFDELLPLEWARAQRAGSALALAMLDVDHFKAYNDHYGHGKGDDCLRRVAQVIKDSLRRPADLVARYGGEELVLLLPDTDATGAAKIAEDCRQAILHEGIPHLASPVAPQITLSTGVAAAPPAQSIDALLQIADAALYQAKASGRNRVVIGAAPATVAEARG